MPNIKLKSNDDKEFTVDFEFVKCSTTIRTMVENLGLDDNDEAVEIPNVNGAIMAKIIEWAEHHQGNPPNNEDGKIGDWDAEFLQKVDRNTLFELIIAANYLDIKSLLYVTTQTVANSFMGKTPEEIRQQFNIKNDFTSKEEEQIREQNKWCEDNESNNR